jgi:hypothetical protein
VTAALPPEAVEVCATWLGLVDELAPGLVTGLHVRGGIGFGEFVPGTSDIDMVAVLDHTVRRTTTIERAGGVARPPRRGRDRRSRSTGFHVTAT